MIFMFGSMLKFTTLVSAIVITNLIVISLLAPSLSTGLAVCGSCAIAKSILSLVYNPAWRIIYPPFWALKIPVTSKVILSTILI